MTFLLLLRIIISRCAKDEDEDVRALNRIKTIIRTRTGSDIIKQQQRNCDEEKAIETKFLSIERKNSNKPMKSATTDGKHEELNKLLDECAKWAERPDVHPKAVDEVILMVEGLESDWKNGEMVK
ncbi:3809_t:CDS:1 [Ambispora gerdemannii]|uniref:3809_t:CDS:1 n=1 Tax=Ambispora gerdemannii TaxID=144530 RepID=A0A9N9AK64_9GLOM|nr:3809_t:CDS:1 [Ambispora gerdemannii]